MGALVAEVDSVVVDSKVEEAGLVAEEVVEVGNIVRRFCTLKYTLTGDFIFSQRELSEARPI